MQFIPKPAANASKPRRRISSWLLLSCLFHAVLLGWIATWAVEAVAERRRAVAETNLMVRSEDVQKLKDYLERNNLAPLRDEVAALQAIKEDILAQRDMRLDQLRTFEDRMTNALPQQLEEAIAKVLASQRDALVAEESSVGKLENLQRTLDAVATAAERKDSATVVAQATNVPTQAAAAKSPQMAAATEQQRTLALMKDAEMLLDWVADTNAVARWTSARAEQVKAGEALIAARNTLGGFEGHAKGHAERIRSRQPVVDALVQKLADARVAQSNAQATVEGALAEARQRAADADQSAREAGRLAADAAATAKNLTEKSRRASEATRKPKATPETKHAAQEEATRAAEASQTASTLSAAAKTAKAAAQEAGKTVKSAETELRAAARPASLTREEQREVDEYRRALRELSSDSGSRTKLDAALAAQKSAMDSVHAAAESILSVVANTHASTFEPIEPSLAAPVADLNAADAYRMAVGIEVEIGTLYREARAAELAMLQGLTMDRALANTQVPTSAHGAVDLPALAADVRTAPALKRFETAFDAAHRDVAAIHSAGASMLQKLQGPDASATVPSSGFDAALTKAGNLRRVDTLADELSGKTQDLSPAMRALAGAPAAPSSSGFHGPSSAAETFKGMPGRSLSPDGRASVWFYIPSWYLIGPFPNEGRKNVDMAFPPESIVDLDAVYTGKGGDPVRWEFTSSPTCQIEPSLHAEYAIYYAYTEVKVPEACDVWLAIGSDDRSDLWVNDVPVWRSSNQLKNWNMTEGFRKVHFQAGRNRLLVRVENGWGTCCFSLLLCSGDEAPPSIKASLGGK